MAHSQLFYGKLSSVSPVNENFQITSGNFTSGSNEFIIADDSLVKVGQTLTYIDSQFTGIVTITNVVSSTITVDQNANASAGSGQTIGLNTPEGTYLVTSASFYDPQGEITVNNITGSNDTNYNNTPIYSILGSAATLVGVIIPGRFNQYSITDVISRNIGTSEISFFMTWGEDGTQSGSGNKLYAGSNQNLAIVNLTINGSLSPIFNSNIAGLSDIAAGSDVAGYQVAITNFIDELTPSNIYYTGSLTSANNSNINFTGSGVVVTTSGSNGVTVEIAGGGGGDTFPYTGSAQITGSLEVIGSFDLLGSSIFSGSIFIDNPITGSSDNNIFLVTTNIANGDPNKFRINEEGVVVFGSFATSPTVVTGGMYFSSGSFYLYE